MPLADIEERRAWDRAYYYANADKCRAARRARAKANRAVETARHADWCRRNPEKSKECKRRHYQKHGDTVRANRREYVAANKARIVAEKKAVYLRDKKAILADRRRYYEENTDAVKARSKASRLANPEPGRRNWQNRRAKKLAVPIGDLAAVAAVMKHIRITKGLRCHWCNKVLPLGKGERHVDHIIPFAKGGAHAADNLCASCPRCNCRKHAKMPDEFRQELAALATTARPPRLPSPARRSGASG